MICPCCNSKRVEIVYTHLWDKYYFVDGEFSLVRCGSCNLEFVSPSLNEKELSKYYPEIEYYSFKEKNRLALVYYKISAYYSSKKNPFFNFLMYPLKNLLQTFYIDKGKVLLEIGCGGGMALQIYQQHGLKTFGLEPYGPNLTEREKRLNISRETIKEAKYPENRFDYIILREVLEHIPDQKQVLERCYKWLKPGGKLIITVPNTKGLWKKIFRQNWYGYDVPRHLYNYNPKNLSFFLEKNRFKVRNIKIYDLPYMLYGSFKFWAAEKKRKKSHELVFSNVFKLLSTPISLIVGFLNMGSLMEIECMKEG